MHVKELLLFLFIVFCNFQLLAQIPNQGNIKVANSIDVSSKNDARLKLYNDSLTLYNSTLQNLKRIDEISDKYKIPITEFRYRKEDDVYNRLTNKPLGYIGLRYETSKHKDSIYVQTKSNKRTLVSSVDVDMDNFYPVYKRPQQPIVLKEKTGKIVEDSSKIIDVSISSKFIKTPPPKNPDIIIPIDNSPKTAPPQEKNTGFMEVQGRNIAYYNLRQKDELVALFTPYGLKEGANGHFYISRFNEVTKGWNGTKLYNSTYEVIIDLETFYSSD